MNKVVEVKGYIYTFKYGEYVILEREEEIIGVHPVERFVSDTEYSEVETPLIKETKEEIEAFLLGEIQSFSVPVKLEGTVFQQQVWEAIREIPYGETKSYSEIAKIIDNEKAVRAVGTACGANPVFIIVPCHRVISQDGSLGGYGGSLDMKEELLELEKKSK